MRKNFLIVMLFIVGLVFVAASFYMAKYKKPIETMEFDVIFKVTTENKIGFDLNNGALVFGKVNPGGGALKNVIIDNQHEFPIKVDVSVSENLLGLLDSETGFIVEPYKNISLPVELNVPSGYAEGNYSGKIKFEIYKSKFINQSKI